jgi:signal transduction histidine kinase
MNEAIAKLIDAAELARRHELDRASKQLHDTAGQHLTALALQLDLLAMDAPEAAEKLAAARPLLDAAFQSVRDLSYGLSPDLASRAGLDAALGAAQRVRIRG